jgi:hypothetical protein
MRTLFAILGLLLCLIAARADELPVIKDSETIRYVGKSVEVRGFVVSVPISPLGTAFINFGQDYPNQIKRSPGLSRPGQKWLLTSELTRCRENHRHYWHSRTLPGGARDKSHVARPDQNLKSRLEGYR